MARRCQRRGWYGVAEHLFQRAASLAGGSAAERAARLNELGVMFKATGRYDDAQALYEEAWRILSSAGLLDAERLAGLYHNLGGLEHARRRYQLGETLARAGLAIRRGFAAADDPALAEDMAALAAILEGCGEHAEAEALYCEALRILGARSRRPDHAYSTAVVLNNLGTMRFRGARLEEAEELLGQALRAKRRLFRRGHPEIAITLTNLARVYERTGRAVEAAAASEEALGFFMRAFGPDHPQTLVCRQTFERFTRPEGARLH